MTVNAARKHQLEYESGSNRLAPPPLLHAGLPFFMQDWSNEHRAGLTIEGCQPMVVVGGFSIPEGLPDCVSVAPEPVVGCYKIYNIAQPLSQPNGAFQYVSGNSSYLCVNTVNVSNENQIVEYVTSRNVPENTAIVSPNLMGQLSEIIEGIQGSKKLAPLSSEMDALYEKAIHSQGAPPNLDEWAAQLANDVANLTD